MFALFEAPIVYFRLSGVIKEYSSAVELMAFAPIDRIGRDGALTYWIEKDAADRASHPKC